MGFLIDFLSHAAIVGFMAGAAIIIGLQQLKGLFGFSHFTNKTDVVSVLESVSESLHSEVSSAMRTMVLFFFFCGIGASYFCSLLCLDVLSLICYKL